MKLCAILSLVLLATSGDAAAQQFKILHSFSCTTGACEPYGGLAIDAAGNLYGTTPGGGDADAAIFKLTPSGGPLELHPPVHPHAQRRVRYCRRPGRRPDRQSLWYLHKRGGHDVESVFELSPDALAPAGWTLQVRHSFLNSHADGQGPWDKVTLDQAGNIYGTTRDGGPEGGAGGVVFELTPDSSGAWNEEILYNFPANSDGCCSYSEVVFDKAGNLYGTGSGDGGPPCFCGVVFRHAAHLNGLEGDCLAPLSREQRRASHGRVGARR